MARITEAPVPNARTTVLWQGYRPRMATATVALLQAVYQETATGRFVHVPGLDGACPAEPA